MEMRRFGLIDISWFLIVLLGAAGARAWYLYDQADNATRTPTQVQADSVTDWQTLTPSTSPGYPVLLSLAADLSDDWQPMVRWVQCGLGALTAGFYFLFARRAFRSLVVGTLAGLLCAAYPFWVINTAELNDGVLTTFLLAACLFFGTRASQVGGPTSSLMYGLGLVGLALVRASLLPFAMVALLWFLLRCRRIKRGWLCALLAFLGFINGLVPWTLRNLQAHGDVYPIVDSAYLHLWIGNNPQADGGPWEGPFGNWSSRVPGKQTVNPLTEVKKVHGPDHYQKLARATVETIKDDPVATVQRRLSAGLYFVFGADWFRKDHVVCVGDQDWSGALTGSLLGLLLLAFLGWRWTYGWRSLAMPSSLAVIWVPLPYLLSHADALSGPRLPLDGVLLCYAAFALACFLPGVGRSLLRGPTERPAPPHVG